MIRFTPEEKAEDYRDIEAMLRDNALQIDIARDLGRSAQYVSNVVTDLDKSGVLTSAELEAIRKKAKEEKEAQLDAKVMPYLMEGINRSQISSKLELDFRVISDSVDRILAAHPELSSVQSVEEKERAEKMNKVLSLVRSKTIPQIYRETQIPVTTIKRYIDELIDMGKLKREEVLHASVEARNREIYALLCSGVSGKEVANTYGLSKSTISKIKSQFEDQKNGIVRPKKVRQKKEVEIREPDPTVLTPTELSVLAFLKEGRPYLFIAKKHKVEQFEIMQIVDKLKKARFISQKMISDAQKKRRQALKDRILILLRRGYTQADIYREINNDTVEEMASSTITRTVTALKEQGIITDQEIQEYQDNSPDGKNTIDRFVNRALGQGMIVSEIVGSDEWGGYLTESRVRQSKKRLKEKGQFDQKAYQKKRKKIQNQRRRQKEKARKTPTQIKTEREELFVWNYMTKMGLKTEEIAQKMGLTWKVVNNRINCILEEKGITRKYLFSLRDAARQKHTDNFLHVKQVFLEQYERLLPALQTQNAYISVFQAVDEFHYPFSTEEVSMLCFSIENEKKLRTRPHVTYGIRKLLEYGLFSEASQLLTTYVMEEETTDELRTYEQQMRASIRAASSKFATDRQACYSKKFI